MGHGTLVGGVQKSVTAGLTLVSGVQRKITKGLTLVGGVQREVLFGSGLLKITIASMFDASRINVVHVEINGTKYNESTTVEVEPGTTVKALVSSWKMYSSITFNGSNVAETTDGINWYYEFTVDSNTNISMEYEGQIGNQGWWIAITTE